MKDMKKETKSLEQAWPHVATVYEVGAILEDSWGYEQTNIDFYCIIKRTGDWVTLLPMTQKTGPEFLFMQNKETPGQILWNAKPFRKKIYKSKDAHTLGQEKGFSIRNYSGGGWCNLWDGKPSTSTHYA